MKETLKVALNTDKGTKALQMAIFILVNMQMESLKVKEFTIGMIMLFIKGSLGMD